MSSPSLCPKELSGGQGVSYVELSEGQKAEKFLVEPQGNRFEPQNQASKNHVLSQDDTGRPAIGDFF